MSRFLRYITCLIAFVLVANSAWAAGYTCPDIKKYTSCNAGFYMTKDGVYDGTPTEGNACTQCPTGCTCAGGTADKICVVAITLNKNGGTGGTSTVYAKYGVGYSLTNFGTTVTSITVPTRAGYTFSGYFTTASGAPTQRITADGVLPANTTFTADTTLYARWAPVCNQITLNNIANSGTGGTTVVYKYTGSNIWYSQSNCTTAITTVTKPSKTNAVYAGTYTNQTSSTTKCIDEDGTLSTSTSCNVSASTTWYARYTCNPNWTGSGTTIGGSCTGDSNTITLDKNGGSGTCGGQTGTTNGTKTCTYGSTCSLPTWNSSTCNITKTKKVFLGWSTSSTCTSTSCRTASFTTSGDATYYAIWADPSISCTNCSGTLSSVNSSNQAVYSVSCNSGYRKENGASANTTSFTATGSAGATSVSATCYAAKTSVSFSANNGSGGQSSAVTATYGSNMPTISTTAPTRTGYTFMGWYDNATYTSGTQYYTAAGASARTWNKTSTSTTLYAGWEANTITINYGTTGYTGGAAPDSHTCSYDGTCTAAGRNTLYNSSKVFKGWSKTANSTTVTYAAGASIKNIVSSGSVTLYPVFQSVTCTPTNGTCGAVSVNSSNVPSATITCSTGYSASGGTNTTTTVTATGSDGSTSISGTCKARTYTVSYAGNSNTGGSAPTSPTSCTYDSTCTAPSNTYSRTGYTFAGWKCTGGNSSCDGDIIAANGSLKNVSNGTNITLTAQWTANCNAITLDHDGNGGSADATIYKKTGSTTYYSNSSCSTTITTITKPTKSNASYAGSYTSSGNSGGTACIDSNGTLSTSTSCNVTGTTTWYSRYTCGTHWTGSGTTIAGACTRNSYTITLNNNEGTGGSGTAIEVYNTKWTNSSGTTITSVTVPTRSGYTFRGYYSADLADVTSNNSSGTQRITKVGALPSNTTFTANTTVYAAWAKNCTVPSNGSCSLSVTDAGVVTYTTSCNTGYTISGNGTATPTCTANTYKISINTNSPTGGTPSKTEVSCTYDANCTLPTRNTMYHSSKVALGWDSKSDGSGTDYSFGGTVKNLTTTNGGTVTLYTRWGTPSGCTKGTGVSTATVSVNSDNTPVCAVTCSTGYSQSGGTNTTATFNKLGTANSTAAVATACVIRSAACSAGYYMAAGAVTCAAVCPAGKYCSGGSTYSYNGSSAQGITGNVNGGYYSTGGGTKASPTEAGNGCLSGYECGKVANGYYSAAGGTTAEGTCVSGQTCGACPTANSSTQRTTFPDEYYPWNSATEAYIKTTTPTVYSIRNQTWGTGWKSINECKAYYSITNAAATFAVESVNYNSSTGKYDTGGTMYYASVGGGYYLDTIYSSTYCNTTTNNMLYKRAILCPANSYCEGGSVPKCSSGTYNDEWGINTCPSGYDDNTATGKAQKSQCQQVCAAGTRVTAADGACTAITSGNIYTLQHTVNAGSTTTVSNCPSGYSISGTTQADHNQKADCKISCSAGYRVASADAACTVPTGSWYTSAHTVSAGSTSTVSSCVNGNYTTPSTTTYTDHDNVNDCKASCAAGTRVTAQNGACTAITSGNVYSLAHSVVQGSTSTSGSTTTQVANCPSGYSISGTTQSDHNQKADCKISCSAGYRVASADAGCTVPTGSWYTSAHTVSAGSTSTVSSCVNSNYTTPSTTTYTDHDNVNDCKASCAAGTRVTAQNGACTAITSGNVYSLAHSVVQGSTSTSGSTTTQVRNCAANYTISGTAQSNHDQQSDCARTITLNKNGGSGTINGTSGTTSASKVCYEGQACSFGSTTGLTAIATTFDGGWGTSEGCDSGTTSFTTPTSATYYACKNTCTACDPGNKASCSLSVVNNSCVWTTACTDGGYNLQNSGKYNPSCTTCEGGSFCKNGTKQSCPAAGTGWTMASTTGLSLVTQCTATTTPSTTSSPIASICKAGTLTKKAKSTTEWNAPTASGLQASANYYVNGTTCSTCSSATGGNYTKSAGGAITAASCYLTTEATKWVQTKGAGQTSCTAGYKCAGGTTIYYNTGTTTGGRAICEGATWSAAGASACETCPSIYVSDTTNGKTAQNQCKVTTGNGYYIAEANDDTKTQCEANYYCPSATVAYGSKNARQACPTAADHKRTTIPSAYYATSFTTMLSNSTGRWDITQCRVINTYHGTHGSLYDYTTYNTSTEKYDVQYGSLLWFKAAPGYYLGGTKTGCGTYAYYAEAKQCEEGYYCPGKEATQCNSSNQSTVQVDHYGRETCPTNYANSAAGATAATQCYLKTNTGDWVETKNAAQVDCKAGGYCPGNVTVYYGSTGGRTACPAGTKNASTGSSASSACTTCASGTYNTTEGNTSCSTCPANSYCTGGTHNATCSSATSSKYTLSAAGSNSVSDCYLTTTKGNYVAEESKGLVQCAANGWCPSGTTVYYNDTEGTRTITGGRTACSTLASGFYPNSPAGSDENTDCYTNSISGGYVKNANDSSATTCANWTWKGSHTVKYGSKSTCDGACPTVTSGWTKGSGTGWDSYADCYQTTAYNTSGSPLSSCAAGALKQTAKSTSAWNTSTITTALSSKPGYRVNGTTCSICEGATYYGGGTATSCTACPDGYTANTSNGKTAASSCQISCAAGTRVVAANAKCTTPAGGWYSAAQTINYGNVTAVNYCPVGFSSASTSASGHDAASDCTISVSGGKYISANNMSVRYIKVTTAGSTANSGSHVSEIQAFASSDGTGTNLLAGKGVSGGNMTNATDGSWDRSPYASGTMIWDLGSAQTVGSIKFALYTDGRTYSDVTVSVSTDNSTFTTVLGPIDIATQNTATAVPEMIVVAPSAQTNCAAGTAKAARTKNLLSAADTCGTCGNWTWSNAGAASCTDCLAATDGWTKATGTGWESYSSCVQTKAAPTSVCTEGAFSKTQTSATAWGSTARNTVKAKAGYFVDLGGLTCSAVAGGRYSTAGNTTTANTGSGAVDAGYFCAGGATTKTPSGTASSVTGASCGVCGGGKYSTGGASSCSTLGAAYYTSGGGTNATGSCLSGYTCGACPTNYDDNTATGKTARTQCQLKCSGGSYVKDVDGACVGLNNVAQYIAAHTVNAGSTSSDSIKSCPAQTSGWTRATGSNWDAVTDCYQTKTSTAISTYCDAGQLKQIGKLSNGSAVWDATTIATALNAKAGAYVNGQTCTQCEAGNYCVGGKTAKAACKDIANTNGIYPNSAAGSDAATDCKTASISGKVVGAENAGTFTTCKAGYFKGAHTVNYGGTSACEACTGAKYSESDGAAACTVCPTASNGTDVTGYGYWNTGKTGDHTVREGCYAQFKAADIANGSTTMYYCYVDEGTDAYGLAATGKICWINVANLKCDAKYYNVSGNNGNTRTSAATIEALFANTCVSVGTGYWSAADVLTRTKCNANYVEGAAASSEAGCALITDKGTYVKTAGAGQIDCPANSYCVGGATIYYGTDGGTTTGGSATCSSGTSGNYTLSAASSDNVGDCYLNTTSTKYVKTASAGQQTCEKGSYCPGGTKVFYSTAGGATVIGGITACAAGAYTDATGQSVCKACQNGTTNTGTGNTACGTTCGNLNDNVNTWTTATWAANKVTNACTIASCKACAANKANCSMSLASNKCTATTSCKGGAYNITRNGYFDASCSDVGVGYWSLNGSNGRTQCEVASDGKRMTTIGYGAGADEEADCGRVLHVGNSKIYLRSVKKTTPSLNVSIGGDVYYGNMGSSTKSGLKIKSGSTTYTVYDDIIGL